MSAAFITTWKSQFGLGVAGGGRGFRLRVGRLFLRWSTAGLGRGAEAGHRTLASSSPAVLKSHERFELSLDRPQVKDHGERFRSNVLIRLPQQHLLSHHVLHAGEDEVLAIPFSRWHRRSGPSVVHPYAFKLALLGVPADDAVAAEIAARSLRAVVVDDGQSAWPKAHHVCAAAGAAIRHHRALDVSLFHLPGGGESHPHI